MSKYKMFMISSKKENFSLDPKKCYTDKICILNKELEFWKSFDAYVNFYEYLYQLLKKTSINADILKLFNKLTKFIVNLKLLKIDIHDIPHLNIDTYKSKVDSIINLVNDDSEVLLNEDNTISELNIIHQSSDKDKSDDEILFIDDEEDLIIPESIYNEYFRHIAFIPGKITGNYNMDIFLTLASQSYTMKADIDHNFYEEYPMLEYSTKFDMHVEALQAVNLIFQGYARLINSSSFRDNKLYIYDTFPVEQYIDGAIIILERSVKVLNFQLTNK